MLTPGEVAVLASVTVGVVAAVATSRAVRVARSTALYDRHPSLRGSITTVANFHPLVERDVDDVVSVVDAEKIAFEYQCHAVRTLFEVTGFLGNGDYDDEDEGEDEDVDVEVESSFTLMDCSFSGLWMVVARCVVAKSSSSSPSSSSASPSSVSSSDSEIVSFTTWLPVHRLVPLTVFTYESRLKLLMSQDNKTPWFTSCARISEENPSQRVKVDQLVRKTVFAHVARLQSLIRLNESTRMNKKRKIVGLCERMYVGSGDVAAAVAVGFGVGSSFLID